MVIYIIYFVFLISNQEIALGLDLLCNRASFSYVKRSSSEFCWLCCLGEDKLILNSFRWRLFSCLNPFLRLLCCPICTYTLRNVTSSKLCSLPCESLARFLSVPWKVWHVLASFSVPLCMSMSFLTVVIQRTLRLEPGFSWGSLSHIEVEFSGFLFLFVCFDFFPSIFPSYFYCTSPPWAYSWVNMAWILLPLQPDLGVLVCSWKTAGRYGELLSQVSSHHCVPFLHISYMLNLVLYWTPWLACFILLVFLCLIITMKFLSLFLWQTSNWCCDFRFLHHGSRQWFWEMWGWLYVDVGYRELRR